MKKHRHRKAAKSEVEALEIRQHMSAATSFAGGVLSLHGAAAQNNTFDVRAVAGNSAVYAIADNRGQVVPESGIKKIVIYTGDDTDTVSINRNSPFSVEVISAAGAIHWVDPGQTETFNGTTVSSLPNHPAKGDGNTSGSSSSESTGSGSSSGDLGSSTSSNAPSGSTGSSGSGSGSSSGSTGAGGSSGSSGTSDSSGSSSSGSISNADTPNPVITFTTATTVLANQSVNVQALASSFGDSDILHSTITWNFGDTGAPYNTLVGLNAAHAYATPGVYTITLTIATPDGHTADATATVTVQANTGTNIYVSTSGNDSNSGLSPDDPIQSLARANQLMTSNTNILFERGDTFDTASATPLNDNGYQNVFIGAYGTGANPIIMYTGPKAEGSLITAQAGTVGLTVEGLTFDSIYTNNMDTGSIPSAITPAGSDIAILNNTFLNVQDDVALNQSPSNVLVQGNSSPDPTALQGYFVWVQGNNIAIVGNTCANSVGESLIRVGGANNLLIAENNLSNIADAGGDVKDIAKASIAIQLGSYAYVYDNVAPSGSMGVGPLYNTLPSSLADVNGQFNYCVFDSNQVNGNIDIEPAAHYTLARNNVLYTDGGDGFVINAVTSLFPNRQAQDVYLLNNTVYDSAQGGGFLLLDNGQALNVVVDNNVFIDPNFGGGSSVIYVDDNNLGSFSQIQDNVWPDTPATVFYVNSVIGVSSSFLTPSEWQANGLSTGDVFENATPTGTFQVSADGFTAGSDLPAEATAIDTMQAAVNQPQLPQVNSPQVSVANSGTVSPQVSVANSAAVSPQVSTSNSGTASPQVSVANSDAVSPQISVASFGAVGDGVTDDSAAIQAAINSAPLGSTLTFTAGKTYLLKTGLVVNKAINIDGNGATLLLDSSAWPQNIALSVGSQLDSQSFTWTQNIAAGTQTFNVAVPTSDIAVGDKVFVSLGRDPYDDTQPNFGVIATVTQNTGSTITIDEPVPYAINQGDQPDSITKIDSLVQNTTVQNLNFNTVSGTITDADVWLSAVQNVTVKNITGAFTIAVQVTDSKNITVQGIQGTETNTFAQAGRAFGAWQSENVSVSDVNVSTAFDKAVFFLESWDRNISISNVQITDTASGPLHADLFHITGGSYGVSLNGISVTDQAPIDFVDSGGIAANYTMSNITINGPIRYFDSGNLTDSLSWNGVSYSDSNMPAFS